MATFTQRGTGSIAESVRSLLGSSGQPKLADLILADRSAAAIRASDAAAERNTSLAEKARLEAATMRDQEALARNPDFAHEYAGNMSGIEPTALPGMRDYLKGRDFQAEYRNNTGVTNYDDGSAPPSTAIAGIPNGVSQQQTDAYRAALATLQSHRLAGGNVSQLATANQNNQETGMRTQLADPGIPAALRAALLESVGPGGNAGAVQRRKIEGQNIVPFDPEEDITTTEQGNALINQHEAAADRSVTQGIADLARAEHDRANADDIRKGRPRAGAKADTTKRVATIDRMANDRYKAAKAAYDALRADQKKRVKEPSLDKIRDEVREEVRREGGGGAAPGGAAPGAEKANAMAAIANGANPAAVKQRYRQRTGEDLDDEE